MYCLIYICNAINIFTVNHVVMCILQFVFIYYKLWKHQERDMAFYVPSVCSFTPKVRYIQSHIPREMLLQRIYLAGMLNHITIIFKITPDNNC